MIVFNRRMEIHVLDALCTQNLRMIGQDVVLMNVELINISFTLVLVEIVLKEV